MKIYCRVALIMFIFSVFTLTALSAAQEKAKLPRTIGPLYLGMTEKKFQKSFNIETYACEDCAKNEVTASIDLEQYPKLFPTTLYKHGGIDCFFVKGRLYKIDIPSSDRQKDVSKKSFSQKYGPPTRTDHWENGVSWMIWEDNTTILSVSFVRRQGTEYPLTLPIDTVISIEYADKAMKKEIMGRFCFSRQRRQHDYGIHAEWKSDDDDL